MDFLSACTKKVVVKLSKEVLRLGSLLVVIRYFSWKDKIKQNMTSTNCLGGPKMTWV